MTDLGIVILAAGLGRRFGGNKAMAMFHGQPMLAHAISVAEGIPDAEMAIVASNGETRCYAEEKNRKVLWNPAPEEGIASSIRRGTAYFGQKDAILFLVCDMPLLTAESVRRLVQAFENSSAAAACLKDGSHSGNPAVFSRRCFPALLELSGEAGGKRVLRQYAQEVLTVPCIFENELTDADTKSALSQLS